MTTSVRKHFVSGLLVRAFPTGETCSGVSGLPRRFCREVVKGSLGKLEETTSKDTFLNPVELMIEAGDQCVISQKLEGKPLPFSNSPIFSSAFYTGVHFPVSEERQDNSAVLL